MFSVCSSLSSIVNHKYAHPHRHRNAPRFCCMRMWPWLKTGAVLKPLERTLYFAFLVINLNRFWICFTNNIIYFVMFQQWRIIQIYCCGFTIYSAWIFDTLFQYTLFFCIGAKECVKQMKAILCFKFLTVFLFKLCTLFSTFKRELHTGGFSSTSQIGRAPPCFSYVLNEMFLFGKAASFHSKSKTIFNTQTTSCCDL